MIRVFAQTAGEFSAFYASLLLEPHPRRGGQARHNHWCCAATSSATLRAGFRRGRIPFQAGRFWV